MNKVENKCNQKKMGRNGFLTVFRCSEEEEARRGNLGCALPADTGTSVISLSQDSKAEQWVLFTQYCLYSFKEKSTKQCDFCHLGPIDRDSETARSREMPCFLCTKHSNYIILN